MRDPKEHYEIETSSEYEAALDNTMKELGTSFADLLKQAESQDFTTPAEFMMWTSVKHRILDTHGPNYTGP